MKERKFYFDYLDENSESKCGMVPVDRVETLIGELLTELNRFYKVVKEMNKVICPRFINNCERDVISREKYDEPKAELITAQGKVETLKNTNHVLEHKVKMNGLVSNFNDLKKRAKAKRPKSSSKKGALK